MSSTTVVIYGRPRAEFHGRRLWALRRVVWRIDILLLQSPKKPLKEPAHYIESRKQELITSHDL